MPVEVMARRGEDTLRFGPLKPKGIADPATGKEPYAVVQLRKDNFEGSLLQYSRLSDPSHLRGAEKGLFR
jgi:methylenetetrahydrofolate--tRNA-(uracil-5-)-methyltransferase